MTVMESIMSLPEKRLPDLEKIPDTAHPDTFLNIPSFILSTSGSGHDTPDKNQRRPSHSPFPGGTAVVAGAFTI